VVGAHFEEVADQVDLGHGSGTKVEANVAESCIRGVIAFNVIITNLRRGSRCAFIADCRLCLLSDQPYFGDLICSIGRLRDYCWCIALYAGIAHIICFVKDFARLSADFYLGATAEPKPCYSETVSTQEGRDNACGLSHQIYGDIIFTVGGRSCEAQVVNLNKHSVSSSRNICESRRD